MSYTRTGFVWVLDVSMCVEFQASLFGPMSIEHHFGTAATEGTLDDS